MNKMQYSNVKCHFIKLVELRSRYTPASCDAVSNATSLKQKKKAPIRACRERGFRQGEYTRTLRLISKLIELRMGYANPASCDAGSNATSLNQKKKAPEWVLFSFGGEKGIRTLDTG